MLRAFRDIWRFRSIFGAPRNENYDKCWSKFRRKWNFSVKTNVLIEPDSLS